MQDNTVTYNCTEKATRTNVNECSKLNEVMKVSIVAFRYIHSSTSNSLLMLPNNNIAPKTVVKTKEHKQYWMKTETTNF